MIQKMAHKTGHFLHHSLLFIGETLFWMFKVLAWGVLGFGVCLIISLAYGFYLHANPYGHSRFNHTDWIAEGEKGDNGDRCYMAGTVVEKILKDGMTKAEAEALVGARSRPQWTEKDGTKFYTYYLGWCSPIAMDPYLLRLVYDRNDILIDFYNLQG